MSSEKKLYKMIYNWYGQVEEEWIRASNKEQAFRLCCAAISVRKNRTASSVRLYLGKANKVEVKEVVEDGTS